MQPPHGYQSGAQPVPQARYTSASGTSSPGQTIPEEPYGSDGSYPDTPGPYSATPGYPQYNNTAYPAPSTTMYSPPAANAYFQPQYPQPSYGTQPAAQQSHPYGSQVTTPIQTSYPSTEYNYVSHGVSDGPPQPCNTYQEHQDPNRTPSYANPVYQTTQQPAGGYQGQYQHPSSTYSAYANESNLRYTVTTENAYSNDTARTAYGNEGGSSRADYGYTYANGSPGVQGQSAQRTYQQQPSQYNGAEYREQQAPGQQPWGAYGGY
ncbi:hypothetical protein M407DRAFT_240414 [Tulasnella calospora MUT 4182]|uniref:Uncharacterized protein n=1 Tax=Tulasnella calospora MUT 4182 TaxID=1051891 RepID=A0A0C3QMZ9_9AGAM|nr:hypothetical protein M407DRAFT_240414 [Tulasnella calospora MUT 4182]